MLQSSPFRRKIGLPLLERFELLIDYSHNRIYATPHPTAAGASFSKDRLGLLVGRKKDHSGFSVVFVAPRSPAENAGFKIGEKISSIDDKTPDTLSIPEQVHLGGSVATFCTRVKIGLSGVSHVRVQVASV